MPEIKDKIRIITYLGKQLEINMLNITKSLTKEELTEKYKDRGEFTVEFILFAYEHYGDLLDFSDTYVTDQDAETVMDINGYCRIKTIPKLFMLQPGTLCYNLVERAIEFVENVKEKRKDVMILPKETIYINNWTDTVFYCEKHDNRYTSRPGNILCGKVACHECNVENTVRTRKRMKLDAIQERLDTKYGKDRFTVLIEETMNDVGISYKRGDQELKKTNVHLLCNECKHKFTVPINTLSKYISGELKKLPCKICEERLKNKKRLDYFVNKFNKQNLEENKYLDFDFSESYLESVLVGGHPMGKIFNIKCNRCGEHFDMLCTNLLSAISCPHCIKSSGELVIESWLRENNIRFKSQFKLLNDSVVNLGHPRGLLIDFVVEIESKNYWIEYHGEQHYVYCTHFKDDLEDFYSQLRRDEFVKLYCENNGIEFLELPWTLKSTEITAILEDILINNTPHPYEFPNIKLVRKKEFPDTGLHRSEFLKQK